MDLDKHLQGDSVMGDDKMESKKLPTGSQHVYRLCTLECSVESVEEEL